MLYTSSEIQESLLVTDDGNKLYSRLLSKECSAAPTLSFRVYYGVASGSVPFMWESQLGTPKHVSSGTTLPPLTPPPSYYYTTRSNSSKLKPSRSLNLIHTILPRLSLKKGANVPASPSSPSSGSLSPISSVSSSSSFSSGASARRRCRRSSSLSFSPSREEDEDSDAGSPISTAMCFGGMMKNALLAIAGGHSSHHGSGAAAA